MDTIRKQRLESGGIPDSRLPDVSDAVEEIRRHFRESYPILLDGALPSGAESGFFVRQARESLAHGRLDPDLLPAAVLRETLAAIGAKANPETAAGLTAVGPHHARVWWDSHLAGDLDDILGNLHKPRPVLRFFDVTNLDPDSGRWNDFFDLDVALDENGRTVELWSADRSYVVELGIVHADGRFLTLARTNCAALPREGKGASGNAEMVRTRLRARGDRRNAGVVPDAAAKDWLESRPDHPDRDFDAEAVVHMLYRAFLLEGPRALRRAPRPIRRAADILRREFLERSRKRTRRAASRIKKKPQPKVLVVRLDPKRKDKEPQSASLAYPLVPVNAPAVVRTAEGLAFLHSAIDQAHNEGLLSLSSAVGKKAVLRKDDLVRSITRQDAAGSLALMASPVFEAARMLHQRLAGIGGDKPRLHNPIEFVLEKERQENTAGNREKYARIRDFGGAESRRFAKAGVKFTRMALVLEGRMRPGAKLKVAGKLVHADADGRFSLECVLSGRKAAIPMRAGSSIGGEVRGQVHVDWEKLPSREQKIMR